MFAPMGCATQRKLLHADWTGMSQCLHTTGSEVGFRALGIRVQEASPC